MKGTDLEDQEQLGGRGAGGGGGGCSMIKYHTALQRDQRNDYS